MGQVWDAIIVGAGVSGSWIANALVQGGMRCLLLEAGRRFARDTYPRNELDANSQLFWGGGTELTRDAAIVLLRPKVVGGGSVVNQALLDRFDDVALDDWREVSGVEFLARSELDPWYDRVADQIPIQTVPEEYRNGNAEVFRRGFEANGYRCAPLERAQRDCRFEDGNSCIVCLAGCPIDSKQSAPVTVLRRALESGLELVPEFEATRVEENAEGVAVTGVGVDGGVVTHRARRLVLASGAIGNSRLLLASGFDAKLPALGRGFYTHPQYMHLAVYDEPIDAFRGPLQSYKSDDPSFRRAGFKLENVFAPPVALAMLIPGFGAGHQARMRKIRHLACIEVAVRDTCPGRVRLTRGGRVVVDKVLNDEDRRRRDRGLEAVHNVFRATGAREVIEGSIAIGLHLMGGLALGVDPARSVVSPGFRLHGSRRIWAADSSVFPSAPGINPSFTIMALSLRAAAGILEGEAA
jgi:choline dehydrogenase-like flavoprotein